MVGAEKHKILVVEDCLVNQKMIQHFLQDDYVLGWATTSSEGYKAVHIFRPNLILLDLILPDSNGFDLLIKLKEDPKTANIPVIIITGLDEDKEEERGFLLGAADYIKKPLKENIVKARIKTQLRFVKKMQAIERMGLIDAVTGISNRHYFENQSKYEWSRAIRQKSCLSLMMIDVDKFKDFNDRYGHPQGDLMLRTISQTIHDTLPRSVDILCRYGGEEFVVMLPDTELEGAELVAERLRSAVEQVGIKHPAAEPKAKVTVSIGIACTTPERGDELSELLKAADQTLYQAKKNGRNRVEKTII